MKTYYIQAISLIILIICSSFITLNQGTISIEVKGLRSNKGFVLVSLFDKEESFPKDASQAVGKAKVKIINGTARVKFNTLAYGNYAAAVLHDENGNLEMDFNFLGMPKEGYGFSNDAKANFGPPSYGKAMFDLQEAEKTIVININYFL